MSNIVRFPTERCRLPNETPAQHAVRQSFKAFFDRVEPWSPPLLKDLAEGKEE